ncbi:hypothetical protein CYMTET_12685 [Cymbomonas tetramitiformis]|uniref:Integrase catalytic domain-containing protein n=1 Tax=Cymbomonas tetramitiformis TaxID=36881 RepID=A0AAE0GJL9_9CHLO|nr:hypothetical protein CYMTET_12685 [Cymbomonas tetramitiformis]
MTDAGLKYPTRESQLQDLVEQQAAFMKTMAETIKVLSAEKKEPEKTSDHEEAESGVISPANAQKTVQCVVKLLGTTKYTGTERNQYESWVQFKTQLESAVTFYPDLLELVCDYPVSDIADIRGLNSFTPKTGGCSKSTAEDKPSSRAGDMRSSRAEYGDNDAEDGDFADGDSFITVPGSASVASTVLSAILKQVTAGDAFDVVRRCGNDGLKAFRKLKCRVEPQLFGQLAGAMKKLCKLTVNVNEDPVKQLGYFGDVMSSVANYGGARLDPTTVEVLVTAMVVAAMPIEYSQVVADMSKERRPSFDMLVQRSEYFFVNVVQQSLVPSQSIVGATVDGETVAVARALVADRRRQSEEKKVNDGKKLICPTCSGVHSAEKCWIVNPEGMEEFIKLNPAKERAVRENYARRLKKIAAKKAPDAAAATVEAATSSSSARPRRTETSAGELWRLENHEEVHVACPVVATVADQKVVYTGEVLEVTWVYGVFNRDKEDDAQVQNEYYEDSVQAPGGDLCAMTVVDSDRELYFDSMATKSIFNDLSMFDGAQVNESAAVSFKVMAGEVTTSRGGGRGSITLWNRLTKKADVLKVEAQYVPESPFNLVSAVSLEDKFGLYAQFGDRVLRDKEHLCEYDVCRKGNVYVLPEVTVEAALPGVECDEKENCPVRDKFTWKFTEFKKWNEEKGPFHLDICADEHNRQVNEYYSLVNSVFLHCLTGRSFWGNPPYDDAFIERLLTKLLMDFPKDPVNTKFLLVLPYKPNAAWWSLTTKFEELHIYSKGSVIFSARTDQCYNVSELVESEPGRVFIQGTPWPVVVLYLDQFVVPRVDARVVAHIRLGHTCDKYVEVMDLQGLDLGVNSEELRNGSVLSCSVRCMACQVAAPKRPSQTTDRGRVPKSVRKVVEKRQASVKMGQLTFTDHGGPFVTSTKGYRGYTIHVDDYSDVCHFYVWKQKLEYVDALEDYRKMVKATGRVFLEEDTSVEQVVYDLDVLVLHSDNDSTIMSGKAKKYCEDNAIVQRATSPYLHENNARAETMNKYLQTKARAMLATAGLPATMWPLAMRHVVYLINRLCKARLGMQSSLQVLNQKYDLSVLRVFGCRAYAFIDASLRSKLADRATPLIYVGHEERSTAYLLYSLDKEKVVRSGMVRFDERVDQYGQLVMSWDPSMLTPLRSLYDCESLDGNFVSAFVGTATIILDLRAYVVQKGDEFTGVVKLSSAGGGSFWTPVSAFLEARVEHLALLFEYCAQWTVNSFYPLFEKVRVQRSGGAEWEAAVVCATAREDHVLPYQVILERHAGVRGSAIDVGEARVRFETRHVALVAQEEKVTGLPVGVTEPKGWVQLVNGPDSVQWQESDHKEECALIDVKKAILPVETVPAGEKVMRMTAVYKAKLDSAGQLTERKTRWVVCGNGQQHGVHYEDVYAPCTQLSTLRILIQLSLVLGLLAFALDVITCFLNGKLDVDVPLYVSWPNARIVRGVRYGILQKSVYGLKQAPRIWYKTSEEFLLAYDHRIRVSNIDPCLFYIWQPGTLVVFVYVHVDDYTVFTSSVEWKVEFFREFSAKWPSKDKGPLVELLGMSMTFSDYGLVRECQISQVGLIQRMLERYSMQDCNPCMTPMEPRLSLMPVDSEEKLEKLPYVNLVMELMWLARCSRPDILTAVCYLARFSHCYGQEHWQHLKRVLRYLKGTIHVCLTMQCSSPASLTAELIVTAYTDADHAADKVTRRSVTGSLVRLNGSTVMYSSKLQKTVAVSTAEAELIALSECARDVEYVVNLLTEFSPVKLPVTIHGDNHASVAQAENVLNNAATRHVAVRNRYVAKLVELGKIVIAKVPTQENLAHFFTKSLALERFRVLSAVVLRYFRRA